VDGCTARDSILLTTMDCTAELEMPNVFSPNGDATNDSFLPAYIRGVTESELTIFNRWGQVVFTNRDVRQGWNGRIDGTPCPEGTYFWIVRYRGVITDWQDMSGHVTVVR
jgi:gliding motility-associated-like protein